MDNNKKEEILDLILLEEILGEVKQERLRQINKEGYTQSVDDNGEPGRLAAAGACYAIRSAFELSQGSGSVLDGKVPIWWPFDPSSWKPKDVRSNLIRAMALLSAELEKMQRQSTQVEPEESMFDEKNT